MSVNRSLPRESAVVAVVDENGVFVAAYAVHDDFGFCLSFSRVVRLFLFSFADDFVYFLSLVPIVRLLLFSVSSDRARFFSPYHVVHLFLFVLSHFSLLLVLSSHESVVG